MKTIFQKLSIAALIVISFSCNDDFKDDIVKDNIPDTPIVFTGAFTTGFNPYYTVAVGTPANTTTPIVITMTIPATSPRSFKSLDRMIAGSTSITAGQAAGTTPASYNPANVVVNGKTLTINTTMAEYNSKVTGAGNQIPATIGTSFVPASPPTFNVNYNERAFMFVVRLDDDTTIIPEQVRIRVTY